VFPSLYFALRDHESDPIRSLEYGTEFGKPELGDRVEFFKGRIDEKRREILDAVIDIYGKLSGNRLVAITHASDTPWKKHKPRVFHTVIPDEETKAYYKKKIGRA